VAQHDGGLAHLRSGGGGLRALPSAGDGGVGRFGVAITLKVNIDSVAVASLKKAIGEMKPRVLGSILHAVRYGTGTRVRVQDLFPPTRVEAQYAGLRDGKDTDAELG
jgi:hypothetical protein